MVAVEVQLINIIHHLDKAAQEVMVGILMTLMVPLLQDILVLQIGEVGVVVPVIHEPEEQEAQVLLF
jgi:hypothetical protein